MRLRLAVLHHGPKPALPYCATSSTAAGGPTGGPMASAAATPTLSAVIASRSNAMSHCTDRGECCCISMAALLRAMSASAEICSEARDFERPIDVVWPAAPGSGTNVHALPTLQHHNVCLT